MYWAYLPIFYVLALTSLAISVTVYLFLPSVANSVPRRVLRNWLLRLATIDLVLIAPGLVALSMLMSGGASAPDDWTAVSVVAFIHVLGPLWVTIQGLRSLQRRGSWFGKTTLLVSFAAIAAGLLTWGAVPTVVSVAVVSIACFVFVLSCPHAYSTVHHAQDTAQGRSLAPVVYLRSFDAEHGPFASVGGELFSLEEFISEAIREALGPLVTLGNPHDTVGLGTAARQHAPDTEWQQRIVELLVKARAIVVLAGDSASLSWELERIRELALHTKLFILTPFEVSAPAPKLHWSLSVAAHVVRLAGIRLPSAKPREPGCPGLVALLAMKGFYSLPERLPPGAVISFSRDFAARIASYGVDPTQLAALMREGLSSQPVSASVVAPVHDQHERGVAAIARRNAWYWVFRYVGSSPYSLVAALALVVSAVLWLQGTPPAMPDLDSFLKRTVRAAFRH